MAILKAPKIIEFTSKALMILSNMDLDHLRPKRIIFEPFLVNYEL